MITGMTKIFSRLRSRYLIGILFLITCCVRVRPPAAWRQIVNAPDFDTDMKEMRNDYNYYVSDETFVLAVNYSLLITVGKKICFVSAVLQIPIGCDVSLKHP